MLRQIGDCLPAEVKPCNDGGKSKQGHRYSRQIAPRRTETLGETGGDHRASVRLPVCVKHTSRRTAFSGNTENYKGRQCAADDCIEKHFKYSPHSLFFGRCLPGRAVQHRQASQSGFIGEYPSCHTVAQRF